MPRKKHPLDLALDQLTAAIMAYADEPSGQNQSFAHKQLDAILALARAEKVEQEGS